MESIPTRVNVVQNSRVQTVKKVRFIIAFYLKTYCSMLFSTTLNRLFVFLLCTEVFLSSYIQLFSLSEIPPLKCMKSADVLLLVDGSASITIRHFKQVRKFLKNLVSRFNVSEDGTNVALLQFSSPWVTKIEFDLDKYNNAADIKKHISSMKYQRGKTFLGDALRKARVQVL